MLTDLEYKILQFVRDGLYGRPVSKSEITNTLGDRLYARDGNQYAQINKTVDSLIARQFLERTRTANKDEIRLTKKGKAALFAYNHRNDTIKVPAKEKKSGIFMLWKSLSKGMKWFVGWIGFIISDVIVELIVKSITGEWTLLIDKIMELL